MKVFSFLCENKSRSFTSFYMSHKILTKEVTYFLKAKVNTSCSPQHDFSLFWQSRPHVLCVQCKDMYSWALQVWFQPTDSVSCLPLPMLSGIKAEMSQNSPSLLPHKIISVYQLHVNPSGPSFLFSRLWFMCGRPRVVYGKRNIMREESNRSHIPMFYSSYLHPCCFQRTF